MITKILSSTFANKHGAIATVGVTNPIWLTWLEGQMLPFKDLLSVVVLLLSAGWLITQMVIKWIEFSERKGK